MDNNCLYNSNKECIGNWPAASGTPWPRPRSVVPTPIHWTAWPAAWSILTIPWIIGRVIRIAHIVPRCSVRAARAYRDIPTPWTVRVGPGSVVLIVTLGLLLLLLLLLGLRWWDVSTANRRLHGSNVLLAWLIHCVGGGVGDLFLDSICQYSFARYI